MKFFNNLNDIQKSFLITTLFIIGISSINTGIINIGSLSSIVISFLFILFYFSSYILINVISNSAIQISSVIVMFCIKVTIYSSIPVAIYLLFLLLIFLLTITILRNQFRWIIFSTLSILIISYYFFNEENIWISDSLDLFEHKKGGTDSKYFTYSTGEDKHRDEYKNPDFLSYSIDASKIMQDDWNQSKINWREIFWGFNKKNIPLNGRLWIPDGNEKYPIISIIHGNHSMQEFSDNGYNYLGEFLSSHGYIFNSVDQNFLNGSWDGDFKGKEMTTRSWHFLENLSYLKKLSSDSLSPLFNKVDFNKVIFIGHSRGGEAVNLAAKFNDLSTYPDNGNVKFNYNFNIIGVVTLAPTDYRYNRNYKLKNINYLSLQGSMDSDEESFFGMRQSNRITNSIDSLVNTNILIEGANHSQFNTSWGKSDLGFPSKYLINYRNIIPDWLQRKILTYYPINFVNYVSGKDLNAIKKLNKSVEYKISTNDELKILSQYQKISKNIKNDFEGNDLGNNENTIVFFENIEKPKLEKLEFRGGKSQQNSALKIKSKKNSRITFKLKNDSFLDNLTLDVYNEIDSSYLNINFLIDNQIVDSTKLKLINNKISLKNYKFNYLTRKKFKKINDIMLTTYKVKKSSRNINSISISFKKTGNYYFDNIAF
ncbi:MAG: hypothetical protein CBC28_03350 [Flavobacteriaceae bacterium TMED68]|nr:MAG: hypothetical protein CBC28_03350 [Flavobacteriaceae bacterium TMED68]